MKGLPAQVRRRLNYIDLDKEFHDLLRIYSQLFKKSDDIEESTNGLIGELVGQLLMNVDEEDYDDDVFMDIWSTTARYVEDKYRDRLLTYFSKLKHS
jgi:hypothetical protein